MFDPQAKQHSLLKRIAIGILVIVAIVLVGYGVAMLLKNISSSIAQNSGKTAAGTLGQTATPSAPSASSVISGYVQQGTIPALDNYQVQQDPSAPARITLKADDKTYAVSVNTTSYALFYAKSTPNASDPKTIASQTADYLKGKGYGPATSVDPSTASTTYATYTNLGAVCQLTSAIASVPAYYMIACVDKPDIDKEYANVKKLLDLYQKSNQLSTFTSAITSTASSGNKIMTTISLTTDKQQHPELLFAAVDNNWEFLGNIGDGSGAVSNGKYSLSPAVISAIHQPKYGDFLTHYLQQ